MNPNTYGIRYIESCNKLISLAAIIVAGRAPATTATATVSAIPSVTTVPAISPIVTAASTVVSTTAIEAAIAAATIEATATAAAVIATAATAAIEAASTSTVETAATAAAASRLLFRFFNGQFLAPDGCAIQGFDRTLCFRIIGHIYETEAFASSRFSVEDDFCGIHNAVQLKHFFQINIIKIRG
jgi:hypothetical protein